MKTEEVFKLVFSKKFQQGNCIGGFDPYDENSISQFFSAKTKPKKEYGIRKIRGFNRVVEIGWSHIIEK